MKHFINCLKTNVLINEYILVWDLNSSHAMTSKSQIQWYSSITCLFSVSSISFCLLNAKLSLLFNIKTSKKTIQPRMITIAFLQCLYKLPTNLYKFFNFVFILLIASFYLISHWLGGVGKKNGFLITHWTTHKKCHILFFKPGYSFHAIVVAFQINVIFIRILSLVLELVIWTQKIPTFDDSVKKWKIYFIFWLMLACGTLFHKKRDSGTKQRHV